MNQLLCSVEERIEMNISLPKLAIKAMQSCPYVSETKCRTVNEGQSTDVYMSH